MILSDSLPPATSYGPSTRGGTLTAGVDEWNLTMITSRTSHSISILEKIDDVRTTDISNTASTTSGVFDPDTSDNTATELTTVNTSANLALTKSSSAEHTPEGQTLTHTLTGPLNGPSDTTGASPFDPIAAASSFGPSTCGA